MLTILLIMVAIAMPFVQNYRMIKQVEPLVSRMETKPGWLLSLLLEDWQEWLYITFDEVELLPFEAVTELYLAYFSTNKTDLSCLSHFSDLDYLALYDSQGSDKDLIHLQGLTKLKSLALSETQVSDEGMIHLRTLVHLHILILSDTKITDAGLVYLKKLQGLTELEIEETQVTPAGVARLSGHRIKYHL